MQGFGCFSGCLAAAFVAYLTSQNHLNDSMTSHQVFRKTLLELGKNVFHYYHLHSWVVLLSVVFVYLFVYLSTQ